jgi:hypothetical protein
MSDHITKIREALEGVKPAGAWSRAGANVEIEESDEWARVTIQCRANKIINRKVAAYVAAANPVAIRSLLAALDEAGRWKELVWALARELNCLPSTYSDANGHVLKAAIALNQKLDEATAARLRAQEENAVLKERLASQHIQLMRELREQGWLSPEDAGEARKKARLYDMLASVPSGTVRLDPPDSFVPQYLHWTSRDQFKSVVDAAIAAQEGGNDG